MQANENPLLRLQYAVQTNKWFAGCDDAMQLALLRMSTERVLKNGDFLYKQNEPSLGFHCILSGCIQVYLNDGSKKHLTLHGLPYEWMGVPPLIDDKPDDASGIARGDTTVATIERDVLLKWLDENPRYWRDFAKLLSYRYRQGVLLMRSISDMPLEQRILHRLKFIATGYGLRTFPLSRIEISQEEIASMLGSNRTSVTLALSKLADQGLVRLGYGEIYLLPASPAPATPGTAVAGTR
jgi:CRP-like cAMP-binding protein